jgi:hypothetical protein
MGINRHGGGDIGLAALRVAMPVFDNTALVERGGAACTSNSRVRIDIDSDQIASQPMAVTFVFCRYMA